MNLGEYVYPDWMILVWVLDCLAALAIGLWLHIDQRRNS